MIPQTLTGEHVLNLRLRAQLLARPVDAQPATINDILRAACGIQAQDLNAAEMAVSARSGEISQEALQQRRQVPHSILRTWAMRGTLHLLTAEDARWLVPMLGPLFIQGDRGRFTALGWDEERSEQGLRLLQDALFEHGVLTREEIILLLREHGLPSDGQAPIHLIYKAALLGILCIGPDVGKKPGYARFEDWAGPLEPRETALAELAQRYLAAYGPATPNDLAAWSGLRLRDARRAWESISGEITELVTAWGTAWVRRADLPLVEELAGQPAQYPPVVRLLPRFDNYLLGYAGRGLIAPPEHVRKVHPGGGMISSTLVVDGLVLGTWEVLRRSAMIEVIIEPFLQLAPEIMPGIEEEAGRIARFLGLSAVLKIVEPRETGD